MSESIDRLSPRQRECLQLVWERQATSKEIAVALGISKLTVDGYIAEAVEALGARDRRTAAAIAFGGLPRKPVPDWIPPTVSGPDAARVVDQPAAAAGMQVSVGRAAMPLPWRTRQRPRNSLLFGQTLGWIAIIALGSLAALALATSVGNGLPPVAKPIVDGVRRVTN